MSKIQEFLSKYKPVYQRSSVLVNVIVTAAIALCTVTLVALRFTQWGNQEKLALLHNQAAALEQENAELSARISELGSVASFRRIAAEILGLVDPDTIVIESD